MGTFRKYATDPNREKDGVEFETEGGTFICRRKGGTNRGYMVALEEKSEKWHRLGFANIPQEDREQINLEAFIDEVIVGWKEDVTWPVDADGNFHTESNVHTWDGVKEEPLPFTRDNALMLLGYVRDLRLELMEGTSLPDAFRFQFREHALGN